MKLNALNRRLKVVLNAKRSSMKQKQRKPAKSSWNCRPTVQLLRVLVRLRLRLSLVLRQPALRVKLL